MSRESYELIETQQFPFPDSNIVSAQMRTTSGTCGFNTYLQDLAGSMLLITAYSLFFVPKKVRHMTYNQSSKAC